MTFYPVSLCLYVDAYKRCASTATYKCVCVYTCVYVCVFNCVSACLPATPAEGRCGGGSWSTRNLLPDNGEWVTQHGLEVHVKMIKLIVIVTLTTILTREISCVMPGWSCVKKYGPAEFFKYYWAEQCCDLLIIFFVSRM